MVPHKSLSRLLFHPRGQRMHNPSCLRSSPSFTITRPPRLSFFLVPSNMDMKEQFRHALDAFKKKAELTSEELQYFQFSSFDDVLTTLSSVQQEQSKKKTLVYMKRIDPFLKTMAEYGKVIKVFVNTSEILAFVWISTRPRLSSMTSLTAAGTVEVSHHGSLKLCRCIQLPVGYLSILLLESYKTLISENAHMRQLLGIIYEDILSVPCCSSSILSAKTYAPPSDRLSVRSHAYLVSTPVVWRSLFQTSWKGFASEIGLLKDNLTRHRRLIETRASLVEFETVQNLRTRSEANFRELKLAEERQCRSAVFQWLSSPNVQDAHERCLEARSWNPKSGHWILAENSFQEWFDPLYCSTPLLWINGKPGAGNFRHSILPLYMLADMSKANPP